MKSKIRVVLSVVSVLVVVISFQNCSEGTFQTKLGNSFQLASENRAESDLSDGLSEDEISEIEETPTNTSKNDDVMPAPIQGSLSPTAPTSAKGKIYYVAKNGDDKNNPGTLAKPFRTIARGSRALAAGDTLFIRAGTYNETMQHNAGGFVFVNGSSSAYTRYAAYPGEERKVILKPDAVVAKSRYAVWFSKRSAFIELRGLVIDGAYATFAALRTDRSSKYKDPKTSDGFAHSYRIQIINNEIKNTGNGSLRVKPGHLGSCVYLAGDNLLKGNHIHNCTSYGVYAGSDAGVIEGNTIENTGRFAVHLYSHNMPSNPNNWIIRNNLFFNNGIRGTLKATLGHSGSIIITKGVNNQVYNNVIHSSWAGIRVTSGARNTLIANNKIYGNKGYGVQIASASVKNTKIVNNVFYNNGGKVIEDYGTGTIFKDNKTTQP